MHEEVITIIWLFAAAMIIAIVAHRLRLPYTVGLVLAGGGLAFTSFGAKFGLTRDLIFDVVLPPLLFEAAINIRWTELKKDLPLVFALAIPGTIIAAAVTAWGMHAAFGWPWQAALLFGSLIAATDPVAVIAMIKEYRLSGRLRLVVEAESLFNDGVAAVLFILVSTWALAPAAPDAMEAARTFLIEVGGGVLIGFAVGGAVLFIAGRSADHMVEATLTTLAAYGAFQVADSFGGSGVLATVTAGLVIGNFGILGEEPAFLQAREFVLGLWEFIAFIASSFIFLEIGLTAGHLPFEKLGLVSAVGIIALVLLGRAVAVYPICLGFTRTRWRVAPMAQHCLWWGGLRGALGLALALSLPESMPWRDAILAATIATVAFSIVAQGLTMKFLLQRMSQEL
jgi:CPA1 family monovalent cation:H+ antiporter